MSTMLASVMMLAAAEAEAAPQVACEVERVGGSAPGCHGVRLPGDRCRHDQLRLLPKFDPRRDNDPDGTWSGWVDGGRATQLRPFQTS